MTVIRRPTPSGYTIFCDDVRVEANGKHIYLGVYLGEMLISPSFPVRLPTFCLIIHYHERPGESTEPVRLAVYLPGEEKPHNEIEVTRSSLEAVPQPDDVDDDTLLQMTGLMMLRDPVFKQPGRIKVRAYRGDDEIRLGTLEVKLHPEATKAATNKEAAN